MNSIMTDTSEKMASLTLAALMVFSVFGGSIALSGAAAAANANPSDYDFDSTLEDGKTHWEGQTLYRHTDINDSETYELYRSTDDGSDLVEQVNSDSDGAILIDTDDFESGEYTLEDESNSDVLSFNLAEQTFDVELEDEDEDQENREYTFDFDSNRATFNVSVENTSDLNGSELMEVFDAPEEKIANVDDDDEDEYVIVGANGDFSVDATFDDETEGTYDFVFNVTDTEASDTISDLDIAESDDADISFNESVYIDQVGDITTFSVSLENTDTADLQIGSDRVNYQYDFTVTDGDDDGSNVTVHFNTLNAGVAGQTLSVEDGADSITRGDESEIVNPPLDGGGTYELTAFTEDGEESDLASISLNERDTNGASIHAVPSNENPSDVEEVKEVVSSSSDVSLGDKFVYRLNASGFEALFEGVTMNDLRADSEFSQDHGIQVQMENNESPVNVDPTRLDVGEGELFTDGDNDTYYMLFDTDDYAEFEEDDTYNVTFNMTQESQFINNDEEAEEQDASAYPTFTERMVEFDGYNEDTELLTVTPTEGYTVSGTTTLAPGTNITVLARSNVDSPFLLDNEVEVTPEGTFETTYDFTRLDRGDEFELLVRGFDAIDVRAGSPSYNLSVDVTDNSGSLLDDATITVDGETYNDTMMLEPGDYSVTASADGFASVTENVTISDGPEELSIALQDNTQNLTVNVFDQTGSTVDATVRVGGQTMEAGDTVELPNGAYTVEAVADGYQLNSQQVTLDGSAQTVQITLTEEVPEQPTTPTPDEENNTESTESNTTTGTPTPNPGQPGFTALFALIALVGAALIAVKRKDE